MLDKYGQNVYAVHMNRIRRPRSLLFHLPVRLLCPFEDGAEETVTAVVDTGCTVGAVLSRALADRLGLVLVRAARSPQGLNGEPLAGEGSTVIVQTPDRDEIETLAFVYEGYGDEVLLGCYLLGQLGAEMTIGSVRHRFPRNNPEQLDPSDLGGHVISGVLGPKR